MSLKKKIGRRRREFTKEFKLKVLAEPDGGLNLVPEPATGRSPSRKTRLHWNQVHSLGKGQQKQANILPD
jgi:hypothetical protein